jgi:cytoskeletal protein CcmA (bactofilin family)
MEYWLRFLNSHREETGWSGFLERTARLEGTLEVLGTFRLDGSLRGRLHGHEIVLGPSAEVSAVVEASVVTICGKFQGSIRAAERVEMREGASVRAEIQAPCIVIEPGVSFEGNCYLGGADAERCIRIATQAPPT